MRTRILQKQKQKNKKKRMTRNLFKVPLSSSQDKKGIPWGQSWISPKPVNLSLGTSAMTPAAARKTFALSWLLFGLPHLVRHQQWVEAVRYKCTAGSKVEVNTDNWRFSVAFSSYRLNRKRGNFTLLFCGGLHGIVLRCMPHVQHAYFSSYNQSHSYFVAKLPWSMLQLES